MKRKYIFSFREEDMVRVRHGLRRGGPVCGRTRLFIFHFAFDHPLYRMTAPHAELDFKALLKLDPITLETVLRRRSAICASHSMAPHFPPFLFLKCLNEVTSQSNAETKWGAYERKHCSCICSPKSSELIVVCRLRPSASWCDLTDLHPNLWHTQWHPLTLWSSYFWFVAQFCSRRGLFWIRGTTTGGGGKWLAIWIWIDDGRIQGPRRFQPTCGK